MQFGLFYVVSDSVTMKSQCNLGDPQSVSCCVLSDWYGHSTFSASFVLFDLQCGLGILLSESYRVSRIVEGSGAHLCGEIQVNSPCIHVCAAHEVRIIACMRCGDFKSYLMFVTCVLVAVYPEIPHLQLKFLFVSSARIPSHENGSLRLICLSVSRVRVAFCEDG